MTKQTNTQQDSILQRKPIVHEKPLQQIYIEQNLLYVQQMMNKQQELYMQKNILAKYLGLHKKKV